MAYRPCDLCHSLCSLRHERVALVILPPGVKLPEQAEVVSETHEPCIAKAGMLQLFGLARKLGEIRTRRSHGRS